MDINDLVLAREDALEKAATDGMTGLLNHTAAEKSIMGLLSKNREMSCAMLIVDIDDLKGINDSLGHMQGDRAICSVAELLRASFRSSDIVGRIGGDEFIVFLLNPPDEKKFAEILMRLMQSMPEIRVGNSNAHSVHISIGVAIGRAGEESFPSLFQKADAALYYVKWHGKAAFAIFRQDMQDFAHVEQLPAQHKGG